MRIKEKIIKIFNKIFKRNSLLMLQNGLDKNLENIDMNEIWKSESIGRNNDFEDEVYEKLDRLYMRSTTKTPEQIVEDILEKEEYSKILNKYPKTKFLLDKWKEKSKEYTYMDKIRLIGEDYSKKLQEFDKKYIDNAISFLKIRYEKHGRDNEDIELIDEAKKIFDLKTEYGNDIKKIFVDNNIDLTHITSISPEELEGGILRKSIDSLNMYETERVDAVFASSTPVDGNNPYIAWKDGELVKLGDSEYIYGNDNIEITKDSEGKNHAMLKEPNYIYHISPEKFEPVCNFTINKTTNEPVFEFSDEWISDTEVDISDNKQVKKIEEVKDVTNILESNTILCDKYNKRIGIQAKNCKSREKRMQFIAEKILEGSVRYINGEAGINARYNKKLEEYEREER